MDNFLRLMGFDPLVNNTELFGHLEKIREEYVGFIEPIQLESALSAAVDNLHPHDYSYEDIKLFVNKQLARVPDPPEPDTPDNIPLPEVVQEPIFNHYSPFVYTTFGHTVETMLGLSKFVLTKHQDFKAPDAEKALGVDPKTYKKLGAAIKKRLNQMIKDSQIEKYKEP